LRDGIDFAALTQHALCERQNARQLARHEVACGLCLVAAQSRQQVVVGVIGISQ
jgi:hypothetical protein